MTTPRGKLPASMGSSEKNDNRDDGHKLVEAGSGSGGGSDDGDQVDEEKLNFARVCSVMFGRQETVERGGKARQGDGRGGGVPS